jgi:transcriptional regulator GlxA family with amidase domain
VRRANRPRGIRRSADCEAVAEIRANFAQPLSIGAPAKLALKSMNPLRDQKALWLQEARRLKVSRTVDARMASRAVGYLSASQFSREYARFFGAAPTKDMARLREKPPAA